MATIHISKTDALRDPASLLKKVSEGATIIIESEDEAPVVVHLGNEDFYAAPDPGHDEWVRARILEGLADQGEGISHETVMAAMREKVETARLKQLGVAS